jgi:hypothetical protein
MEHPGKEYKVTYKTYYNQRLKKSFFHTKLMHPLYIQVIFDRIPITFKSYYYDLFSKSKYAIQVAGQLYTPDIKQIIIKEKALLDFIINNNLQSFSLDLFKKEYAFYCRDLLDIMEGDFSNYLYTLFHDEGLPFLAETFQQGASVSVLYRLVQDMKKALDSRLYNKLIDNSFYYASPYLPLYAFTEKSKSNPPVSLTVMEWMRPETKEKFTVFFKKQYPEYDITETFRKIQQFITHAGK